jgi:Na+-transporting NADH:ubiquinone oxidoreductase subunit NqrD
MGGRLLLSKAHLFAFFGGFDRGIMDEQVLAILAAIRQLFGIENQVSIRLFKNMEQKAASIIARRKKRTSN